MATKKQDYGNDSISALKAQTGSGSGPASFSALTDWRAASTRCSRFSPTPSMRPGRATAGPSLSPGLQTGPSRWRTRAGAARWTGMRRSSGTTGAGVLRAVRRRQVRQRLRRQLRIFLRAQRIGCLRHPVRLPVHGRHRLAGRL